MTVHVVCFLLCIPIAVKGIPLTRSNCATRHAGNERNRPVLAKAAVHEGYQEFKNADIGASQLLPCKQKLPSNVSKKPLGKMFALQNSRLQCRGAFCIGVSKYVTLHAMWRSSF